MEMNERLNKLLEVKKERDSLLEEKIRLVEDKNSYWKHTSELKERVQKLLVSDFICVPVKFVSYTKYQSITDTSFSDGRVL